MSFVSLNPLLFNKVLVLAKSESTYNTDPSPSQASNALLVSNADVAVNPTVLTRSTIRPSISPSGITIGKKLVQVTLEHELKGSGAVGTAPAMDALLQACGFAKSTIANTAAATITAPVTRTGNSSPAAAATFAKTSAATQTGRYRITCVKGGASATAKIRVTGVPACPDDTIMPSETFSASYTGTTTLTQGLTTGSDYSSITYTVAGVFAAGDVVTAVVGGVSFPLTVTLAMTDTDGVGVALAALIDADARFVASDTTSVVTVTFPSNSSTSNTSAVAITSGTTAVKIGNTGGSVTPTWSGSLVVGDAWDVQVLEPGVHYTPVSASFVSATIYVYYDGILHKVTGCFGTVSFSGEAGNYGKASFTFTGQYIAPVDATLPSSPVYETTLPAQVELAQLTVDGIDDFCASSFSVDMQNQVVARDCINQTDGFNGVIITNRTPQGSINPEMTTIAQFGWHSFLAAATKIPFHVRVGSTAGNIVKIIGDSCQLSGVKYNARNNVRAIDVGLNFSAYADGGNDEIRVIFA